MGVDENTCTLKAGVLSAWHMGDFVTWKTDLRHVGQSLIPVSHVLGVVDVKWNTGTWSRDVPVNQLRLHSRNYFKISISEYQRSRIASALSAAIMNNMFSKRANSGDDVYCDTERHAMEMLLGTLRELPEEDAKLQRDCTHGLCL